MKIRKDSPRVGSVIVSLLPRKNSPCSGPRIFFPVFREKLLFWVSRFAERRPNDILRRLPGYRTGLLSRRTDAAPFSLRIVRVCPFVVASVLYNEAGSLSGTLLLYLRRILLLFLLRSGLFSSILKKSRELVSRLIRSPSLKMDRSYCRAPSVVPKRSSANRIGAGDFIMSSIWNYLIYMIEEHLENGQIFYSSRAFCSRQLGILRLHILLVPVLPLFGYILQRFSGIGLFAGLIASVFAGLSAFFRLRKYRALKSCRLEVGRGYVELYSGSRLLVSAAGNGVCDMTRFELGSGRCCGGFLLRDTPDGEVLFAVLDESALNSDCSGIVRPLPQYWIPLDGEGFCGCMQKMTPGR